MTLGICPFALDLTGAMGAHTYSKAGPAKVGFCDHTAGGFYRTLASPSFWNGAGISVHFGISRQGEICQLVNIFDRAYAQGRLGPNVTWLPYGSMNRVNPNEYLISTEHEDAMTVNGRTVFVPGAEWTPEMYDADLRVKRWCVEECNRRGANVLQFGLDSLAGHYMFDGVNRAECPGRFWRNEYRNRLYFDMRVGPLQPQPEPLEEDEMKSHYAWATWFEGRMLGTTPPSQYLVAQIRTDFQLPTDAKAVLFQSVLESGDVQWFHGESETPVAEVGKDTFIGNMAANGTLNFRTEGGVRFKRLQCVGYYK